MLQQIILPKFNNKLEEQINKLFHSSDLPMHFNKTGNKEFTNYQRISIIILFYRSKKSIRDFIDEFKETKWISWLGLAKIPKKSTLHDWLKLFDLNLIRKIHKKVLPEKVEIASIDSTGFDSWQRSRHYEKRCEELTEKKLFPMSFAKASLFIDVKTMSILDFDLTLSHRHDVKIAERIFKRNKIKNIFGLGDKGYDSENLHEIARENGISFYAPTRKMDKRAFADKRPKGFYRRKCKENPPEVKGMRSKKESVNSVLKRTQIHFLRSKKPFMKKRELGWQVIVFNLKIKVSESNNCQNFIFCQVWIVVFPDRAALSIILNSSFVGSFYAKKSDE